MTGYGLTLTVMAVNQSYFVVVHMGAQDVPRPERPER